MTKRPKLSETELWNVPLSERIRYLRERHAPTQDAFARLVGTTRETVNRWESGQAPQRRHADALARLEDHPVGMYAAESDMQWAAREISTLRSAVESMHRDFGGEVTGQLGQQNDLLTKLGALAVRLEQAVSLLVAVAERLDPVEEAPGLLGEKRRPA